MDNADEMMLAFNGSVYIEHPMSIYRDEGFLKLCEFQRNADVAFANLECAIVDGDEWPVYGPGMSYFNSYLGAPPMMVDELKFIGINAVYAGDNHVSDFGELGIISTIKHLRAGGIEFAGIGESLSEATEPCYISTPHGRVALIAAADWGPRDRMDMPPQWPAGYMASDEGIRYRSRPGTNLLRYEAALHVDRQAMAELRRISEQMGWETAKKARSLGAGAANAARTTPVGMDWEQDSEDVFYFMGRKFVLDDSFGFSTFPYKEDEEVMYKGIREARRSADIVIAAVHDQVHGDTIPDYVRIISHGAIDAGADIFVCTAGASSATGIEIYNGKPIIHMVYDLGFQNSQVRHIPPTLLQRRGLDPNGSAADFYASRAAGIQKAVTEGIGKPHWSEQVGSVIYATIYDKDLKLTELRAYPMKQLPGSHHLLPVLVEPGTDLHKEILDREKKYCDEMGTPFEYGKEYGIIPFG